MNQIKVDQLTVQTFSNIFSGAMNRYGKLTYVDEVTGKKSCTEPKQPIPMEQHLLQQQYLGRSPVNEDTKEASWYGIDVDIKLNAKEFCSNIFNKIGPEYFCFQTFNKKWRVIKFLDKPIDVEEVAIKAKDLEARVEKELNIKVDTIATTPTVPNEDNAVGRWLFLPYGKSYDVCFTPDGRPLTLKQFFFRYFNRNHPIIVAAVGMVGQGGSDTDAKQGSRSKALFNIALYKKHFECDASLEEVNANFAFELPHNDFKKEKDHVLKSVEKDAYTEEYFLNGQSKWIYEMCGVRPAQSEKAFTAISDAIVKNHIYVQSRTDFRELDTNLWLSKEQLNDWWLHEKPKGISSELLKNSKLVKVRGFLTHAGLPAGVVSLKHNEVKGLPAGEYLNVYEPNELEAVKGDVTKINEYYSWLLGDDNWLIVKQMLSFMLKAKQEHEYYVKTGFCGLKIQWFVIMHSQMHGAGKKLFAQLCQSLFGVNNVRPSVKFKQLVSTHSTLLEGAQLIFLNEVSLTNNTAKTRELSNEFKELITEDNLMINPKFKKEVEIPNLCNFFVFSNSETPLYIENEDRRAFVINIDKTKEAATAKLKDHGYKWEILKVIKNPAAFKYHLLNEVTYDREMFFEDAPVTAAKLDMIEKNKDDITAILEERYQNREFPFANHVETRGTGDFEEVTLKWTYTGLAHPVDMFLALKKATKEIPTSVFFTRSHIENFIKSKATKFPNGEYTFQARGPDNKRKRLYCTHVEQHPDRAERYYSDGQWIEETPVMKYNTELTDSELWRLYETGYIYDTRQ